MLSGMRSAPPKRFRWAPARNPPIVRPFKEDGMRSSLLATAFAATLAGVGRAGGDAMKLPPRQFLRSAATAIAAPALSRIAWGQAYPARPGRDIVGFPPGRSEGLGA